MAKEEVEFFPVETIRFTPCEGNVPTLSERILASEIDGAVSTRMLRFEAGTDTTSNGVLVHDFWEEVYILEGDLTDLRLGETFRAGSYACGRGYGAWSVALC